MASKFAYRSNEAELMDDLRSSGEVIDRTLRELEVINRWLGGNKVTLDGFDMLLSKTGFSSNRPLRIVDIGCGGGDMLKLIARHLRRQGIHAALIGIDANPHIVAFAKNNTRDYPEISYRPHNIFSETFRSMSFDIVTCTLFTHHFTDSQLVELFAQLRRQATLGMVINDLHRHALAYYSIKMLTALFSRSEMVRNDAAVSVLRAFRKTELASLLRAAGIHEFSLRWMWAFRWQAVVW